MLNESILDEETIKIINLFKPIKDPQESWDVDVSSLLANYIEIIEKHKELELIYDNEEFEFASYPIRNGINFSHASTILAEATKIYSRKVEFLKYQINQTFNILYSGNSITKSSNDKNAKKKISNTQFSKWHIKNIEESADLLHLYDYDVIETLHEFSNKFARKNEDELLFNSPVVLQKFKLHSQKLKNDHRIPADLHTISLLHNNCNYNTPFALFSDYYAERPIKNYTVFDVYRELQKEYLHIAFNIDEKYNLVLNKILNINSLIDEEQLSLPSKVIDDNIETTTDAKIDSKTIRMSIGNIDSLHQISSADDLYMATTIQPNLLAKQSIIRKSIETTNKEANTIASNNSANVVTIFENEHANIENGIPLKVTRTQKLTKIAVLTGNINSYSFDVLNILSGGTSAFQDFLNKNYNSQKTICNELKKHYTNNFVETYSDILDDGLPLYPILSLKNCNKRKKLILLKKQKVARNDKVILNKMANNNDGIDVVNEVENDDNMLINADLYDNDHSESLTDEKQEHNHSISLKRTSLMDTFSSETNVGVTEIDLIKLYDQLLSWRALVDKWILLNKNQKPFHIDNYLDSFYREICNRQNENKKKISFKELCNKTSMTKYDVCRYFFSALLLVNKMKISIEQNRSELIISLNKME